MQDARLDRWKARVFGGFDGDRPLVAKDEGFEGVIEAATDTMESITAGSEVSTVPDVRDDAEDDDTDQLDEDQPESDVDGEPEQTGLEK